MTSAWNRGEAVAAAASGDPPALFTTTSSRPNRPWLCRTVASRLLRVADVGRDEDRGPAPAATGARRARSGRRPPRRRRRRGSRGRCRADALRAAGDEHRRRPDGSTLQRTLSPRTVSDWLPIDGANRTCYAPTKQALGESAVDGDGRWAIEVAPLETGSPRSSWTTRRSTRCRCRAGSTWPPRSPPPAPIRGSRVVILAAEGRGFNAGVDIKEMQRTPARGADRRQPGLLCGVRGRLRVRRAGHRRRARLLPRRRHRPGGQRGLIVAAEDATFGLPEVDRGALGAATHLARLVPQHLMRPWSTRARPSPPRSCTASGRCSRWCPAAGSARPRGRWRPPSRPRTRGHPAGEAVAERHRPGRRQAQLPLRAGLHLRAQPPGRGDRARQAFVDAQEAREAEAVGQRAAEATAHDARSWTEERGSAAREGGAWKARRAAGNTVSLPVLTPDEVVAEFATA